MSKGGSVPLRETAARLIAIDTVSSNSNYAAVAFMADYLGAVGMNVVIQEDVVDGVWKANLLASMGPQTPDGLLISGHIDVVPFSDQAGWTTDPLILQVGDERVYGRGTSDMKVFIAQCLCAASQLDVRTLRRPLVYAFTYDEEVGCRGAQRLAPEMARLLGNMPLPRICWIGEPTSGKIFHAQKGSVIFQIRVIGRAAHSGTPEAGTNAVAAMSRLLGRIDRYASELAAHPRRRYLELFPRSPFPTINIASVNGGGILNSVPDCCSAEVFYRPLPGEDPLELYEEIRRRILSEPLRPYGPAAGAAEVVLGPPLIIPGVLSNRHPTLESALSAAMGTWGSTGAPFGTDACMFCAAGIDCVICGPGDLGEAHRPNESISRKAFECGHQAILSVIRKVCC
jgi:acetylornithine deacetylase